MALVVWPSPSLDTAMCNHGLYLTPQRPHVYYWAWCQRDTPTKLKIVHVVLSNVNLHVSIFEKNKQIHHWENQILLLEFATIVCTWPFLDSTHVTCGPDNLWWHNCPWRYICWKYDWNVNPCQTNLISLTKAFSISYFLELVAQCCFSSGSSVKL